MASVLTGGWALGVRLNLTASLPLGLYIATDQPTDYVAFCLGGQPEKIALARQYITSGHCPGGGTPLLKPIVARPSDSVIYSHAGIAVNGLPEYCAAAARRAGPSARYISLRDIRRTMARFGSRPPTTAAVLTRDTGDPFLLPFACISGRYGFHRKA